MSQSMPAQVETETGHDSRLLACFNWERRRRSLTAVLPAGRWHAFELWQGRYYGEVEGALTFGGVPSHGARLVALRRSKGRPQVVGSTFHISMGGREVVEERFDAAAGVLTLRLRPVAKKRGELIVVPAGMRLASAAFGRGELRPRPMPGALGFSFELAAESTLELRFSPTVPPE
jgi:hypothetical protein